MQQMVQELGSNFRPRGTPQLRHTHAALLIAQNVHPSVIKDRLGHSSIKTTLDTYGHLYPHADRVAAEALDELFLAPPAVPAAVPAPDNVISANFGSA
jgi:integrase